ncbi:MAG: IclR family transcriptional regulator [Actinomycetes bacterium]
MNGGPTPKRVPAVQNALAVLEHLRSVHNEPRTLSEIARATDLNVSTCFNLLKTLEDGLVVSFDPARKSYRLGLRLAELGAMVDGRSQAAQLVLEEARSITDTVGLGCFLMGRKDATSFVVLDKVESRKPIRVTIDRGATFPLTGAVAAKAWFAWSSGEAIRDLVGGRSLPHHTDRSITDLDAFEGELTTTRARGYSTSVGEYYPGHNAVAAAVFGQDGAPVFLLVVVGADTELTPDDLERVGGVVAAGAVRATQRIGGRLPSEA